MFWFASRFGFGVPAPERIQVDQVEHLAEVHREASLR